MCSCRRLFLVALLALPACVAQLEPDHGAIIACATLADCPNGWSCIGSKCIPADAINVTLPRPEVVLFLPRDGELDVSQRPTILLAFSMEVDSGSVEEHLRLTADGADPLAPPLPLTITASALSTTYLVTLTQPASPSPALDLLPATAYTLVVSPGITPTDATAQASDTEQRSGFTTQRAVDRTPPGPVQNLVVDHLADDRVDLRWDKPATIAGEDEAVAYLVMRRAGLPLGASDANEPEAGRLYASGAAIGDGQVLVLTTAPEWVDVAVVAGVYDYEVFALDHANNYSAGSSPPFYQGSHLDWCTDEQGGLLLDSVDTAPAPSPAKAQIRFTLPAASPCASSTYPTDAQPGGGPLAMPAGLCTAIGPEIPFRPVIMGPGGTYIGREERFRLAPAQLTVTHQPLGVQPGGESFVIVAPDVWPGFEAEMDATPAIGGPSTVPVATAVAGGGILARYTPAGVGTYRFRLRPVKPGCQPALWTDSTPFDAGSYYYVSAGGSGNGGDPAHAIGTINAALVATKNVHATTADQIVDIYVSQGDYDEALVVEGWTRLWGSYDLAFRSRSLDLPSSVVTAPSGLHALQPDTTGSTCDELLVDGFVLTATDDSPLYLSGWGSASGYACPAVIRNCRIVGPTTISGDAVTLFGANGALIENSTILGPRDCAGCNNPSTAVNTTDASANGVVFELRHNIIEVGPQPGPVIGVSASGYVGAVLDGNTVRAQSSAATAVGAAAPTGLFVRLWVLNNLIIANGAGLGSAALFVGDQGGGDTISVVTNNTLVSRGAQGVAFNSLRGWPRTANNLFVQEGDSSIPCVTAQGSRFPRLANNGFAGCTVLLQEFAGPALVTVCGPGPGDGPGTLGTADCTTLYAADSTGDLAIADPAALGLAGGEDYHLTAITPPRVRGGGMDASAASCGGVSTDHDGQPRTCDPAGPCYSIGAYEQD